ncbi:hypothetical protein [Ornithinimicrobium kibberense]|uniref:hypothetical protein n=1 Tax=Ornithinimicrobium kibberense TaxID=282060 RepID=UPI003621E57F
MLHHRPWPGTRGLVHPGDGPGIGRRHPRAGRAGGRGRAHRRRRARRQQPGPTSPADRLRP